jgi:biopolymer transport protein ExbB
MSPENFLRLANESGGVIYLMFILLFVALFIIIERLKHLADMKIVGLQLIELCQNPKSLIKQDLINLEQGHPDIPAFQLIKVAMNKDISTITREDLDGELEEVIMHEVPHLDRGVWILDTIITLAPLLGLFGTIVGMFNAMSGLTDMQNSAMQISSGISEALVSTAFGLIIAMFGLSFYNNINTRIRLLVHQMETLKVMIVNRRNQFQNLV